MDKILFLDIDGPLSSERAKILINGKYDAYAFDPVAVKFLNYVLSQGVKIVLSSSWRTNGWNQTEFIDHFESNGLHAEYSFFNPEWKTYHHMNSRGQEIEFWFIMNKSKLSKDLIYCILDDSSIDGVDHCDNDLVESSVKADAYYGISYENYFQMCKILQIEN